MRKQPDQMYWATDFTRENEFTSGIEGPAVDQKGNIYAVNFGEQGTIGIVNPHGQSKLFVHLPEGSTGNGIRMGPTGHLYIADYTGHNVLKIDVESKKVDVHAHNDEMNQPNDLAITTSGFLFASDPNWNESTGQLWRINPDGSTQLLESNMGTTNGIEVSPDEKTLYVNESVQRKVWAYDLSAQGDITNKRLLHQFEDHGMDGMRCDKNGNLYVTRYGKGTVAILSPNGTFLREVAMKGKKTSNIAFGGLDGQTAYITLQDRGCFEVFRTEYAGRSFKMWNEKE
ncbi:MAG: SMP-30/gluconolactonase/LRE family protein [Saprospiraceae bacterium]|nr:SMP-30/gluconolactonase/LRE family protein [Saprospiraceae bacterium]